MTLPKHSAAESPVPVSWAQTLQVYLEPASLRMLSLGFSAGLPLLLVFGTLSFWLREAGVDRSTIGFLSWVGLAYGFKWVWSPLVDRMPIPVLTRLLGRRRSWLLVSQAVIMLGLISMALTDPKLALAPIVWCAIAVAFGSATQDIALDAFRIESADVTHQAALAASYQTGYRLAMIWAGAGVLWIAARAEVGLRTVFRHFRDMDSLYAEMARTIEGEMSDLIGRPRRGDIDHDESARDDLVVDGEADPAIAGRQWSLRSCVRHCEWSLEGGRVGGSCQARAGGQVQRFADRDLAGLKPGRNGICGRLIGGRRVGRGDDRAAGDADARKHATQPGHERSVVVK